MKIKIAAIQMNCSSSVEKNLGKMLAFIDSAVSKNARIVCFPELSLTGYHPSRIKNLKGALLKERETLSRKAKEKNIFIIAGIPEKSGKKLYNSAIVFSPSGKQEAYRKINLFPGKPVSEMDVFSFGNKRKIFDFGPIKGGMAICFDLRFAEHFTDLARKNAHVIFVPSAFPAKRISHWDALLSSRAIENQCYVLGINRSGKDGRLLLGGNSAGYDPHGRKLFKLDSTGEKTVFCTIDTDIITEARKHFKSF